MENKTENALNDLENAKLLIINEKNSRAKICLDEINETLKKHNCTLSVSKVVVVDGVNVNPTIQAL